MTHAFRASTYAIASRNAARYTTRIASVVPSNAARTPKTASALKYVAMKPGADDHAAHGKRRDDDALGLARAA